MRSIITKIVGVTFNNPAGRDRQELLELFDRQLAQDENPLLTVQRDHNNPHDPNAVAVLNIEGEQLGYLSRNVASTIAPLLDSGTYVSIKPLQITGGGSRFFGLNVQLDYVDEKELAAVPF